MTQKHAIIYLAHNLVNGKGYIGKTSGDFQRRKRKHLQLAARRPNTTTPFHRAINKYGPDAFEWSILSKQQFTSNEEHFAQEKRFIALFQTYLIDGFGYNATRGGDGGCYAMTEETRQKMRIANRLRHGNIREYTTSFPKHQKSISLRGLWNVNYKPKPPKKPRGWGGLPEERKAEIRAKMKATHSKHEMKKKHRQAGIQRWKDSGYRQKQKDYWTPERREQARIHGRQSATQRADSDYWTPERRKQARVLGRTHGPKGATHKSMLKAISTFCSQLKSCEDPEKAVRIHQQIAGYARKLGLAA